MRTTLCHFLSTGSNVRGWLLCRRQCGNVIGTSWWVSLRICCPVHHIFTHTHTFFPLELLIKNTKAGERYTDSLFEPAAQKQVTEDETAHRWDEGVRRWGSGDGHVANSWNTDPSRVPGVTLRSIRSYVAGKMLSWNSLWAFVLLSHSIKCLWVCTILVMSATLFNVVSTSWL